MNNVRENRNERARESDRIQEKVRIRVQWWSKDSFLRLFLLLNIHPEAKKDGGRNLFNRYKFSVVEIVCSAILHSQLVHTSEYTNLCTSVIV